jgi:hypothetical protein
MERIRQQKERGASEESASAGGEDDRFVPTKGQGPEAAQERDEKGRQGSDEWGAQVRSTIVGRYSKPWCFLPPKRRN